MADRRHGESPRPPPATVGYYQFTNLAPGTYSVRELQPTGWLDGKDTAGSHGGTVDQRSHQRAFVLAFGDDADRVQLRRTAARLDRAAACMRTTDDDCDFDDPDVLLEGVQIDLLDAGGKRAGHHAHRRRTASTNSPASCRARTRSASISPPRTSTAASASAPRGGAATTSASGSASSPASISPRASTRFSTTSARSTPGSISGRIHADTGPDCDFDNPDCCSKACRSICSTPTGNVLETTYTNAAGEYSFTRPAAGEYQVREHQPSEYYDGGERVGTAGGSAYDVGDEFSIFTGIHLTAGLDAIQYDFCEKIGVMLSGHVYHDRSNDGLFDPHDRRRHRAASW